MDKFLHLKKHSFIGSQHDIKHLRTRTLGAHITRSYTHSRSDLPTNPQSASEGTIMNSSCRNRMRQGCHGARVTSRRTHTECYCLAILRKHHKKQKKKVLHAICVAGTFLDKRENVTPNDPNALAKTLMFLNFKKKTWNGFFKWMQQQMSLHFDLIFFGEHPLPPLGTHPLHVLVSGSEAHGTQPWPLALHVYCWFLKQYKITTREVS